MRSTPGSPRRAESSATGRATRHALPDRVFHWLTALTLLTLLGTGFLPVLGVRIGWVTPHWIAGLVLTFLVAWHAVRALGWLSASSMWIGSRDFRDAWQLMRWSLRIAGVDFPKPGKYSVAQKLFHHCVTAAAMAAIVTGLMMMVRIDTPLWRRNPYWLDADTWGIVFVVHGFTALSFVTLVIIHVYFALRPENLMYTRSMLRGWITETEKREHHDESRWR